ncbi:MAG: substrate-binding domain-containing protein, partial [Nakamurella sp.]
EWRHRDPRLRQFQYGETKDRRRHNDAKGDDVLVVAPVDTTAAAALVTQAQAQGIKVITYDSSVLGAKPDYQVERNNTAAGRMHAEAALAAVPSGNYAIIRGDQSSSVAQGMGAAYDELLLTNPGINVVYDQWTPGWDAAQAQKNAEAALVANNNDIDAFIVSWDDGAQGVAQALKSAGVAANDVYVTGTDGAVPSLKNIADGWQDMSVWTRIDQMATSAADIAHALGTGEALPTPDTTSAAGVPIRNAELIAVDEPGLCDFLTSIAPAGWATPQDILGSSTACD